MQKVTFDKKRIVYVNGIRVGEIVGERGRNAYYVSADFGFWMDNGKRFDLGASYYRDAKREVIRIIEELQ